MRVCGIEWCNTEVDESDDGNTVIDPGMCPAHWKDFLFAANWIRDKGSKNPSANQWIKHRNGLVRILYVVSKITQ